MNQNGFGGILIIILLLSIIFQGCIQEENENNNTEYKTNFVVDSAGSTAYQSIQEALDTAPPNATIIVLEGHYTENIFIDKPVSLIGEHYHTTIIDGERNVSVVHIYPDEVTFSNFTLINSGDYGNDAGILVRGNHATISNCIIQDNYQGIFIYRATDCMIKNNSIRSNTHNGIYAYGQSNNMNIVNNRLYDNNVSIHIKGTEHCIIRENRFNNSEKGVYLCCGAQHNQVYHNIFVEHNDVHATDESGSNS